MTTEVLYDVVAINHKTSKVRVIASDKSLPNAEAIVNMAVMRRGCNEECFTETRVGTYKDGDLWGKEEKQ